MQLGSEQHKQLFCHSFLDTHLEYQPQNLPWPELDQTNLNRLKSIPFWREALTIEQRERSESPLMLINR
jgi:hypothetical protein